MKSKAIQLIPAIAVLSIIGFRYFSLWCTDIGHICYRTLLDSIFLGIINPADNFARYFILVAIVLFFIPHKIFNSWLKFAIWAIPLAFFGIMTTDVYPPAGGILGMVPSTDWSRDGYASFYGAVISIVTILIIIYELLQRKLSKTAVIDLKPFFVAIVAFITTVGTFAMFFANLPISYLSLLANLTLLTFATNIYTLIIAVPTIHQKRKARVSLGWKLLLSVTLFSLDIAMVATVVVIFYLHASGLL